MNRVLVTGIGLVTPLGIGREKTWQRLIAGESAVSRDHTSHGHLTARVDNVEAHKETRLLSLGFLATAEALHDAKLRFTPDDTARVGMLVCASKPNLHLMSPTMLDVEGYAPAALGVQLARVFKIRGPVRNITAACATGTNAIALGAAWIRDGLCDIVVAGAAESSFHPLYEAGFARMGVLARTCAAPFDCRREGFAMGEGAGVVVLESYGHASLRGARNYGEIVGTALACDAYHPASFRRDGAVIAAAVKHALTAAGRSRVDYINAHGTGTRLNDVVETAALKAAFGDAAYTIPVSSTKAATGHLLGATGAVEFGFCLLALRNNIIPPTLNLEHPDPSCDLDYVPGQARRQQISSALSVSFGFGGQIGVLVAAKI